MLWTLSLLTRHFFRLGTARILLLVFTLLLIWWLEFVPAEQGSGARGIVDSWPRWLAYAWLLMHGSRRFELPHREAPSERLLSWSSLRLVLEASLALLSGEAILLGLRLLYPVGFHVEPSLLLLNVLLCASACLLSLGLRIWGQAHELGLWMLLGLMELVILRARRLEEIQVTFQVALGLLLCAAGLLALSHGVQGIRKSLTEKAHRCESRS